MKGLAHTLAVMATLAACRADQNRVHWVDEVRLVRVKVDSGGPDLAGYSLSVIGEDSQRHPIESYTFDRATAELSFHLDDSLLLKEQKLGLGERIASMGDEPPASSERFSAWGRLELVPMNLDATTGRVAYAQAWIPLLLADVLASNREVQVESPLAWQVVSYHAVVVKDEASLPIAGASVLPLVNGELDSATKAKAWHSPLYRPIIHTTGSDGTTHVLPLDSSLGADASFSLIAYAPGYCTFVSAPIAVDDASPTLVTLKKCAAADQSDTGFEVSFASSVATFPETVAGGEAAVAYTNARLVPVRIDAHSPNLRGVSIKVTEGHGPNGVANAAIPILNLEEETKRFNYKFQSEVIVEVPLLFSSTNSENGDFTIHISSNADTSSAATKYLYGRKSVAKPSFAFTRNLKLRGSEVERVLSGLSGAQLDVEAPLCGEGMQLGVSVLNQDPLFAACSAGKASFSVDDLPLPGASTKEGGNVTFSLYLKDRYGNTSKDDPAESHKFEAFVDYGAPDLSSQPLALGIDFGFAPSSAAKGNDSLPYTFAYGSLQGSTTDTVVLSPTGASGYVLRFAAPASCFTKQGTAADGTIYGNSGLAIHKFAIASSSTALTDTSFQLCQEGDEAADRLIKADDIKFPDDASAAATFVLQVIDTAGHRSSSYTYSIPSCPDQVESTPGTAYCWRR